MYNCNDWWYGYGERGSEAYCCEGGRCDNNNRSGSRKVEGKVLVPLRAIFESLGAEKF